MLNYYGGIMLTADIGINSYENFVIYGFVELVAFILSAIIVNKYQRKSSCKVLAFLISIV